MFSAVFALVILVLAVVTLFWVILKNASQRIAAQFAVLAETFGLECHQPDTAMGGFIRPEPSLYGNYAGRELSISVPGKGLQNTRQIETVLKVELRDSAFAAQLTANGLLGGIRQRDGRGLERWRSGDGPFDAAWDVRVAPGAPAAQVFTPEIRSELAALLKAGKGNLYIGGGILAYAELGLIANEAVRLRFEQAIRNLYRLAETIEAAQGLNNG